MTAKIVLFKAESDNESDDYLELFRRNQFESYTVSPIRFEFKNLDTLSAKLDKTNFSLNYSSLVITSPRVIRILKHLIDHQQLCLHSLRRLPMLTVGPQTQQKLIDELQITSLVDNKQFNVNNAKDLANYLIERQSELSTQLDLSKPLLYPTSDLSKEELKAYLSDSPYKVEKLICYLTLPNDRLDTELRSIVKKSDDDSNARSEEQKIINIENSFLFVFFSPYGVTSVNQMVRCVRSERVKSIAIGLTTKKSIEENGMNLIATSPKPTPEALLDTVRNCLRIQFSRCDQLS